MNKTILMGRLTKDPEVKYLQDENSTAKGRIEKGGKERYGEEENISGIYSGSTS